MHSFGCHFVEVTWQPATARLRVSRVVTVIDGGRIINPLAGRNQIEGAVVMGVGMALLEHTIYDPQNGAPINSNLADYLMSVNADAPLDGSAFPRLSRHRREPAGRSRNWRNRPGRHRRCDHGGYVSRHRRARARTANQNRRPADVFDSGLTNESITANYRTCRRKSLTSRRTCRPHKKFQRRHRSVAILRASMAR